MSLYVQVPIQQIADGLTAIGWSSAGGGGDATLSYGSTEPTTPVNGTLWYDTTATLLKLYTGGTWTTINVSAETISTIQGYATSAQASANTATQKLTEFKATQVTATTLSAGASATASYNSGTGVITLGIPTGATGTQGIQGIQGLKGDTGTQGIQGIQGETGNGITSVTRTAGDGSAGTTDTYTITYTDMTTSTFNVYNGANGEVSSATLTAAIANQTGSTITGLKETSVAMASNNIDLATGNLFTKTISGATTLTVSNIPTSGTVCYFILQLTNGGSATVTWFSGVKWSGGTAPTLTSSGKDILSFYTIDAGTTWNVVSIQKDVK